jgi:hypothetical protein
MASALTRLPPEKLEHGFNGGLQKHVQASPAFGRSNRRWHSIAPPRCAGYATHSMPPDLLREEKLQLEAQLPVGRQLGPLHVVEGLQLGIDR